MSENRPIERRGRGSAAAAMSRRALLGAAVSAALPLGLRAQEPGQWFDITSDEGREVPNMRVPITLVLEVLGLPGLVWYGPESAATVLIEFFDYNCPYCRRAEPEVQALLASVPDFRVGYVNNAILSVASADAARVELAVLRTGGPEPVRALHARLLAERGRVDGRRALDAAAELGLDRERLAAMAEGEPVRSAFADQTRLAASLGLAATPSFILGGIGILGWPGPKALRAMVDAVRRCDRIVC